GELVKVQMFVGSRHPSRARTTTRPPHTAAKAARATIAARSGGVWVARASASTNARIHAGRSVIGKAGRSGSWKATGKDQVGLSGLSECPLSSEFGTAARRE